MTDQPTESIFAKYADISTFHSTKKHSHSPLKDHPQLTVLADILGRSAQHHVMLQGSASDKINLAFMQSFSQMVSIDFIYFDLNRFALCQGNPDLLAEQFNLLANELAREDKPILFAINHANLFNDGAHPVFQLAGKWIQEHLFDNRWRFIILTNHAKQTLPEHIQQYFSTLILSEPNDTELLAIINSYREELEHFHHVIIPDDMAMNALALAKHYLAKKHHLDNAYELLDSSAAHAYNNEKTAHPTTASKAVLTHSILLSVITNWTRVPPPYLHYNKFKAAKLTQGLQKYIFGQDTAIHIITSILQHACLRLVKSHGTLCNFLWVGPADTGKSEMALALSELLYGHSETFFRVIPSDVNSLDDVTVYSENKSMRLFDAVLQAPYAVIFIENINQNSLRLLQLLQPIMSQGSAYDATGKKYSFHHCILIISTTLASEHIRSLMPTSHSEEEAQSLDLMQLVLNQTPTNPAAIRTPSHLSMHEMTDGMIPELLKHFPSEILRDLHVVPFFSLDYAALEKIVRIKLSSLGKRLQARFNLELTYAPEALRFLVHEVLWRKEHKTLEQVLEQHLYSCVAQEVLAYIDDKHRPKQLLLQLNASGQMLRCHSTLAESHPSELRDV